MDIHIDDLGSDFTWGVSSSAYQTEGAPREDGKGESIWDVFTHLPGKITSGQNGNTACNFYERYVQDLILMQYMNIRNFRFSISWPRILPEGTGRINEKGIDYYNRLIDFCLEQQIEPWITLYHWDLPQALEQKGGWTNRDVIHWFSDYAELCMKKFSDRVQHWMVLNEPAVFTGAGYFLGLHAPGKKGLSNFLPSVHHAALVQSLAGRLIRSFRTDLRVGTTFSCAPVDASDGSKGSIEAAQRVDVILNRLFIEPLLGLGYPASDLKILHQLEKYFVAGDEKLLPFDMDFIGLQNYTREVVQHSSVVPYINARIIKASRRNAPRTAMDWEIYPEGIYRILKQFAAYKKIKSIIITENGAAFDDQVQNGTVHDEERVDFLRRYLFNVCKAKKEGMPVDGYFAWSFTDNFEWSEGYAKRFGLVHVDYATQKRIIKSSGLWYKDLLQNHAQLIHAKAV